MKPAILAVFLLLACALGAQDGMASLYNADYSVDGHVYCTEGPGLEGAAVHIRYWYRLQGATNWWYLQTTEYTDEDGYFLSTVTIGTDYPLAEVDINAQCGTVSRWIDNAEPDITYSLRHWRFYCSGPEVWLEDPDWGEKTVPADESVSWGAIKGLYR